jgi:hypothetical protein
MDSPSRRRWLSVAAFASFGTLTRMAAPARADAADAARQGVIRVRGAARLNAMPAASGMPVSLGDELTTSPGAELIVVRDADALLIRGGSRIRLDRAAAGAKYVLRVVTGAVLAVFAPGAPK